MIRFPFDTAFHRIPPASHTDCVHPQVQHRIFQRSESVRIDSAQVFGSTVMKNFWIVVIVFPLDLNILLEIPAEMNDFLGSL